LDSINIVHVKFNREKENEKIKVLYKLNSTMIFNVKFPTKTIKNSDISISLSKQVLLHLI